MGKDKVDDLISKIKVKFPSFENNVVPFFAQFEMELSQLDEEEAEAFKEDLWDYRFCVNKNFKDFIPTPWFAIIFHCG